MIIDHIHDNTHATLMNFVDKVFEFLNALGWICRRAGVHTCQREVVLRVIAPVIVAVAGSVLVHALSIFQLIYKVITQNGQELNMGHSQVFQIIQFLNES